jgi:hypothetical protein
VPFCRRPSVFVTPQVGSYRPILMASPPVGRRELLLKAKAKALVRSRWGDVVDLATDAAFPGGAGFAHGTTAWVLAEDEPARSLGGALVWALRQGAEELHLLTTGADGLLARRAAAFDRPISVWPIVGTALADAPAAPAPPLAPEPPVDPAVEPFVALFERAGAEAVWEGGVLRAEVRGLEVARIEVDDEGPHLAVGVGKHDREAQREIRGRNQGFDELFEVVRIVAEHRVAEGAGHAAFHLAPERWLRSVVVRRPDLVGAAALHAVPPPSSRDDLRQSAVAPAAGTSPAGEPLLVVCSVGTDVDLVPSAADVRAADGRDPRLVLVLPEGDVHRMTTDLAAALREPAEIRTVPSTWRTV